MTGIDNNILKVIYILKNVTVYTKIYNILNIYIYIFKSLKKYIRFFSFLITLKSEYIL